MAEFLLTAITRGMAQKLSDTCEHNRILRNCVLCIFALYSDTGRSKYDERCPKVVKEIVVVDHAPCYNYETDRAKKEEM